MQLRTHAQGKHCGRKIASSQRMRSQLALLVLRGEGLTPIAEGLPVSLTTVKTHLRHVFDKTAGPDGSRLAAKCTAPGHTDRSWPPSSHSTPIPTTRRC